MKTISRRVSTLETQFARRRVEEQGCSMAESIRESRRRRLVASGLPFEERSPEPLLSVDGRCPTIGEVIRHARAQRLAREAANS
jgi:hypothetical protein